MYGNCLMTSPNSNAIKITLPYLYILKPTKGTFFSMSKKVDLMSLHTKSLFTDLSIKSGIVDRGDFRVFS